MHPALNLLLGGCGVALIAGTIVDVTWTALAAGSGGGPVTRRIGGRLWHLAAVAFRRRDARRPLEVAGVLVVVAVLITWIGAILAGWSLVFLAADEAVVSVRDGDPASLVERLYYAGYTVFTLGNGDMRPGGALWDVATVLAAGTGLVIVTLSITYLVPIASAVAERRQLASLINALGSNGHDIVRRNWDGSGFGLLAQQLSGVAQQLQLARQRHFAYPVLHYFRSGTRESALAPNLVSLADALLLLDEGVAASLRPDVGVRRTLEATIDAFLDTLGPAYIRSDRDPLPIPPLGPLRETGIEVVPEATYRAAERGQAHRRRLLGALLDDDGWGTP